MSKPFAWLLKDADGAELEKKSKEAIVDDGNDVGPTDEEIKKAEKEIAELTEELDKAKKKRAKAKKDEDMDDDDDEVEEKSAKLLSKCMEYTTQFATKAAALTKAHLEGKKAMADANARLIHLEGLLEKGAPKAEDKGMAGEAVKSAFAVFQKLSLKHDHLISADEIKQLNTMKGPEGGFLCPPEWANELIKAITEISDIRKMARIRRIAGKELILPKRIQLLQAFWTKELNEFPEDKSQYGQQKIIPHKLTVNTGISNEMLGDAMFDMAAEILSDASEAYAYSEGVAFVKGQGDAEEQPQGFVSDPRTPVYVAVSAEATSGSFSWKDLVLTTGQLKNAYARNAVWGLNRRTLAMIMTMTDGYGRPIWQANLAEGRPNTIAGLPYIIIPDMPDVGVGAKPIVLADWVRFYHIVDREGVEMIIDPYTEAKFGVVKYTMHKRVGGAVVLPEAGILLQVKA